MLAMVIFSGVRKRLEAQPPKCFEGLPITPGGRGCYRAFLRRLRRLIEGIFGTV